MACVDAIGQVESVFCLCCSRSFLQAELPCHVTNDHFGFLPFACTSCDFTAASEREVLEHAKEKRHIPYVADHSSSKPYLSLLVRLVVSHCKTFARTDDFAAILAELTAQIAAHENGFSEMKLQREFAFVENPQQLDSESSSERSVSTSRSAQNASLRLRGEPQYGGAHADLVNSSYSPQSGVGVGVSATSKRKAMLPKQPTSALVARNLSAALPEQGSSNKRTNAAVMCALCASGGELFSEHEKEGHVMQHLELRAAFASEPKEPEAYFTEIATMWRHCFPALDEPVAAETPGAALDGVATRQDPVTGGSLSDHLNSFIAQQTELLAYRKFTHESSAFSCEPVGDEGVAVSDEITVKPRRYPARRSSSMNAAGIIASSLLEASPLEAVNRRGKRNDLFKKGLETTESPHAIDNNGNGKRALFCRLCDRALAKHTKFVRHVWCHHMDGHKQFTCGVCKAENNSGSQLRIGCQANHPTSAPIMKAPSADVRKMFALRYRQCFAKNPNRSAGYHCKGTSRESGSSEPASRHHQNAAAQRRISAALTAKAICHECQICAESVVARTYSLKYHAMHKHFTAPQKVFECSKCGFGNNEWRCHVAQHVKKVHRGQQGKGVRVIDRSVKFSIKIHACLKSCFPEAEFAPPWGKIAPKNIDGYHAADSGVAAVHSSENPPEFDLPGSSGYDPSQEFGGAEKPSGDGFDESNAEEGFVNVAVKAELINDRAANSFTDTAAASAFC